MKSFYLFLCLSLGALTAARSQTTAVTVDANNVMNSSNANLNIISGVGQSFFVGRQAGSGYVSTAGIFRAMTDNPYGTNNWYYEGMLNGITNYLVRADGNMKLGTGPQGYYAGYSTVSLGHATNGGVIDFHKGNALTGLVYGDGYGLSLYAPTGYGLHLYSNNNENMTLLTNGDVSVPNGNLLFANSSSLLSSDQHGSIELGSSTAPASNPYLDMHYGGQSIGQDYNVRLMNNGNNQLQVLTASSGAVLTVKGGSVGIGTAQPDQALTVNGTVHATKVLVETSVPAPDYVFEKGYRLRPLSELKAYVDRCHHLPEVPSAAEMAKHGVDVNEINFKLLQKVEELTLYVIQKDKKQTEQQKFNTKLLKQVKFLERKLNMQKSR